MPEGRVGQPVVGIARNDGHGHGHGFAAARNIELRGRREAEVILDAVIEDHAHRVIDHEQHKQYAYDDADGARIDARAFGHGAGKAVAGGVPDGGQAVADGAQEVGHKAH